MFDRYNTVDKEDTRAAVSQLEGFFANADQTVDFSKTSPSEKGLLVSVFDSTSKYCIIPSSNHRIECFSKYLMQAKTWQQSTYHHQR